MWLFIYYINELYFLKIEVSLDLININNKSIILLSYYILMYII